MHARAPLRRGHEHDRALALAARGPPPAIRGPTRAGARTAGTSACGGQSARRPRPSPESGPPPDPRRRADAAPMPEAVSGRIRPAAGRGRGDRAPFGAAGDGREAERPRRAPIPRGRGEAAAPGARSALTGVGERTPGGRCRPCSSSALMTRCEARSRRPALRLLRVRPRRCRRGDAARRRGSKRGAPRTSRSDGRGRRRRRSDCSAPLRVRGRRAMRARLQRTPH